MLGQERVQALELVWVLGQALALVLEQVWVPGQERGQALEWVWVLGQEQAWGLHLDRQLVPGIRLNSGQAGLLYHCVSVYSASSFAT